MPSTVNGIGTWYYGKKNLRERQGTCSHCGRFAKLSNYDTRLWVVFFFIPIIPLKRQHIYAQCSLCTYHSAVDPRKWQESGANAIEEGIKRLREHPDDPGAAINLYHAYQVFDHADEAEKMMQHLRDNFSANYDVQMFLGATFDNVNRPGDAMERFKHAMTIDPNRNEARRAIGLLLLKQDKLDDAHAMLTPVVQDDELYDGPVVYTLAEAYRKAKRNAEAYELIKIAVKRTPEWRKDPVVRKLARAVEKALGHRKSIVEAAHWSHNPWMLAPLAGVLMLCVALFSVYRSYNRTVYVISGAPQPVTVSIADGPTITVNSASHQTVNLAEGVHTITYSGGVQGTQTFALNGTFFGRLFDNKFVCLNVGGSGVLLWQSAVYTTSPNNSIPPQYQFYFGKPVIELKDIDHPFEPFPKSITSDSKYSNETRRRVELLTVNRYQLFMNLFSRSMTNEAISLAEWYLPQHPEDVDFIESYIEMVAPAYPDRARSFILKRCAQRPVDILWHRARQDLPMSREDRVAMQREYDALLAADTKNPDLLYLRSRLSRTSSEALPYLKAALEVEPKHAFALSSQCFHLIHRGEWNEAYPIAQRVIADRPALARWHFITAAYGAGRLKELELFLKGELKVEPRSLLSAEDLCLLLASQGRMPEAAAVKDEFTIAVAKDDTKKDGTYKRPELAMLYAARDFKAIDRALIGATALSEWKKVVAVETDNVKQLEKLAAKDARRPLETLFCAVVLKNGGNVELAASMRARALKALGEMEESYAVMQQWLTGADGPPVEAVLDLAIQKDDELLLLVALADTFPKLRGQYLPVLERLNVVPQYPYHWLKRYVERMKQ